MTFCKRHQPKKKNLVGLVKNAGREEEKGMVWWSEKTVAKKKKKNGSWIEWVSSRGGWWNDGDLGGAVASVFLSSLALFILSYFFCLPLHKLLIRLMTPKTFFFKKNHLNLGLLTPIIVKDPMLGMNQDE